MARKPQRIVSIFLAKQNKQAKVELIAKRKKELFRQKKPTTKELVDKKNEEIQKNIQQGQLFSVVGRKRKPSRLGVVAEKIISLAEWKQEQIKELEKQSKEDRYQKEALKAFFDPEIKEYGLVIRGFLGQLDGLRADIYTAYHGFYRPKESIKNIAKRTKFSEKYIEKIINEINSELAKFIGKRISKQNSIKQINQYKIRKNR